MKHASADTISAVRSSSCAGPVGVVGRDELRAELGEALVAQEQRLLAIVHGHVLEPERRLGGERLGQALVPLVAGGPERTATVARSPPPSGTTSTEAAAPSTISHRARSVARATAGATERRSASGSSPGPAPRRRAAGTVASGALTTTLSAPSRSSPSSATAARMASMVARGGAIASCRPAERPLLAQPLRVVGAELRHLHRHRGLGREDVEHLEFVVGERPALEPAEHDDPGDRALVDHRRHEDALGFDRHARDRIEVGLVRDVEESPRRSAQRGLAHDPHPDLRAVGPDLLGERVADDRGLELGAAVASEVDDDTSPTG